MRTIVIDPVTRIEGHLKIEATVDGGLVKEARSTGTLFRGLELILRDRDPRDAPRITQRICGVCPTAHSTASTFALDQAFGIEDRIPANGRILRNLIFGCNYIQSHVLHFYHLAALDFVDVTAIAGYDGADPGLAAAKAFLARGALGPFVPRYEGDYRFSIDVARRLASHYVQAFDIRRKAHELLAMFGGKMPHNVGIVPGGVTKVPEVDSIVAFLWRLNELRHFIDHVYVPDVIEVARVYGDYAEIGAGSGKFLDFGGFPLERGRFFGAGTISMDLAPRALDTAKITESVAHSWYADDSSPRHPSAGKTLPAPTKREAYSWLKAPRYEGDVYEGGPLARMLLAYARDAATVKTPVDHVLNALGVGAEALNSVLGRHAARAIECKVIADAMAGWVLELVPGGEVYASYDVPSEGQGAGLVAAPRGALGHWVGLKGGKIDRYQCVVPTTWNASPKDERGQPGPIERAIIGTRIRDEENPFEIVRIVRSFDPCLACAVHLTTPRGRTLSRFVVG